MISVRLNEEQALGCDHQDQMKTLRTYDVQQGVLCAGSNPDTG